MQQGRSLSPLSLATYTGKQQVATKSQEVEFNS